MKKENKSIIILTFLSILITTNTFTQTFKQTPQGVEGTVQGMDIKVEFYTHNTVRVYKTPQNNPHNKKSLSVIKLPDKVSLKFNNRRNKISLKSNTITVEINKQTGGIYFFDTKGNRLLIDKDYGTQFTSIKEAEASSYTIREGFALDKEEAIYGVGQIMDNKFNRRNSSYKMQNENMFTYSPYFLSAKGYAVFWDNYSIANFNDNEQELSFEGTGHCADYYFMYGGSADGTIAQVRELTGKTPMLPLWAYGFFQSKERYHTQEESLNVLKKYRDLKVPIDVIIQDWRYWPQYKNTDSSWNSQSFDTKRFPNPKKWVEEIHKLNAKLLIVTWPGFGPKTNQRKELDSKNMILNFDTWPPKSGARPYDVYNPQAREIYWNYLNKGIFSYINNDGWWLDSTEPDHINRKDSDYDLPTYLGSYRSVKNAYSMMHNNGIATHQKAQNTKKRVVILTRSGFIGQQRFGSNTWSGDVRSTWDMLEKQIPAALNFTLMGIPHWNSDIGGFFAKHWEKGGGVNNPEFQELYVRWMQFGAFCPMMRSHGTDLPREIWNFGERGTWCFDAQEKYINLRYQLLPYIYSTSWDVSHNNGTFMRPLLMDFIADKNTYNIGNQYMFGRSLLVTPVTKYETKKWEVYLPEGANWYNFWTNEFLEGGQTVTTNAPIDIIPLYVKAGSIIPWGPKVQFSTEKKWDNLELKIYTGTNSNFILYEDEFDNYNYENGSYTEIPITWIESGRKLIIGKRKGTYKGMLKNRKFKITLEDGSNKTINYNGKKVEVIFN